MVTVTVRLPIWFFTFEDDGPGLTVTTDEVPDAPIRGCQ